MNEIATTDVRSPLQRTVVEAAMTSFAILVLLYWLARPAVELLDSRAAELLAYSILPVAVIFIFLYRSNWHREITGAARTCSLAVLSFFIFGCEIVVTLFLFGIAMFCMMAISGGNH
jgi:hypothetical protein